MTGKPLLQVGSVCLDASRARDRREITGLLRCCGRVRALAHRGQAAPLIGLLRELDHEQQAAILAAPRAVWDLVTCGVAQQVTALIAEMNAPQRTLVLSGERAVSGLVREHRSAVWGWLEGLPPASQAIVLCAQGALAALIIDCESASKVVGLIEKLDPSDQVGVFSRTDAIDYLVEREQSACVLSLLAPRSGAELAKILARCGTLPRLAAEGRVTQLAELMTRMTRIERFRILAWGDALLAFTQNGRRAQVLEWLLALDAHEQKELSSLLPKLSERLHGHPLREEMRQRVVTAIEWLEAQPVPGCFSISDHATWAALRAPMGLPPLRFVTALTKLTLEQRARLLLRSSAVSLLARGAGEATAQLIAELTQGEQLDILLQPSALDVLVWEGAGSLVLRMLEAFPPNAQVQLLREVAGNWKEALWPPPALAHKLALLLGDLEPTKRLQLIERDNIAALLVTHGYGAHVTGLLDTCPQQRVQLLQARDLIAALLETEGISAVAARFESLPPRECASLFADTPFLVTCVELGLAPTLFRLLEALEPAELDGALDSPDDFTGRRPGPLLAEWRSWLELPADQRLNLVVRSSTESR